jgi:hypothetical protein
VLESVIKRWTEASPERAERRKRARERSEGGKKP